MHEYPSSLQSPGNHLLRPFGLIAEIKNHEWRIHLNLNVAEFLTAQRTSVAICDATRRMENRRGAEILQADRRHENPQA